MRFRLLISSVLLLSSLFLKARADNFYQVDLSTWPKDIVQKIEGTAPQIKKNQLTKTELDNLLKQLDQQFNFNSLKLISVDGSNLLKLVGDVNVKFQTPEFKGLVRLAPGEAISLMGLAGKSHFDQEDLQTASNKLIEYYHSQGYRFAEVKYEYKDADTIEKIIVFNVNAKSRTELSEITITGLDQSLQEELSSQISQKYRGSVVTQDTLGDINRSIRRLLSRNGYYLAIINNPQLIYNSKETKVKAIYKIERTKRFKIEIHNINEFPRLRIEEDVLDLDNYFSSDENIIPDLTNRIKDFYYSQGYAFIEVNPAVTRENDRDVLILVLEEGPYTRINSIRFVGQFSRPEKFYIQRFLDFTSEKVQKKIYIKEDVEKAAKNLVTYLQNEGYVSAKLGRVQSIPAEDSKKKINLTVQLTEGPQTLIREILFIGNKSIPSAELLKVLEMSPSEPLSLNKLEKAILALKIHYASLGFIEVKITNENSDLITYSDKNESVHLKFRIEEGAKVKAQTIVIEGNNKTHDKILIIELDFKEGDYLTPAKLEESIARLQRTGLFSSVEIGTLEAGTLIADRTVIVKVVERAPGIFNVGGGWNSENNGTVHGYMGIAYRNLGGWARGASARVEGNYNYANVQFLESKITLGYVEPYLFESRARMRINHTRSRLVSDINIRKVTEKNAGILSIEQDFSSHITGIWELLNVATYIDRGIEVEDEIKYGYSRQDLVISTTGPILDFDYRNNLFNPTSGSFHRLSFEVSIPSLSSNVDRFFRAIGLTNWYFPISNEEYVFAQSLQAGYVKVIEHTELGVPFDKKGFTLGGRTTIRGFESSEFFPSTSVTGINYRLNSHALYQLVKSEFRFPIVSKWGLMGALFYDGGQVLINGLALEDPWRNAVGVGFRYNTPVGPLNIEYGFKLDKKAGESEGAFHLSLGIF